MAKHTGKHTAKRSKAAGAAAVLVLMFSGFLLVTNLRVNRSVVVTNDTAELVEQRVKKVNSLQTEVDALSSRVNDLSKTLSSQDGTDPQDSESAGTGTMLPAVEGPGLVVTLDDSQDVTIYRQYVSAFGLGWQVEEKEKLHFEATDALQQPLQYAQAMSDGTEETQQTDATQQLQDVQESQEGK